jgi:two-component system OmpR family response regulator
VCVRVEGTAVHVLVVDDEPDLVVLCQMGLSAAGHQVDIAMDGAEALTAMSADPPDIVVLDFMMPGMDGLSVLERMQRDFTDPELLPVVMLSAKGRPEDAVRGLAAGATAYVTKPFSIDELESLLAAIVAEDIPARQLRRTRTLAALTAGRR